jgi:hypothetical protein
VDDEDARQVLRWSLGRPVSATVASRIPTHGDVTEDGDVTPIDAQQILRWSVGLFTAFPVGETLPPCEGIRVTTTTTGVSFDPDGYSIFLDGAFQSNVGVNATVDLASAAPGAHTVLLQGLAVNCSVANGPASRPVTLVEGEPAPVHYDVECVGIGQGALRVRNVTTCSVPPGSYTVTLDGTGQSMAVGGMVEFYGVPFGTHQVTLANVPTECAVDGGATKTISISSGSTLLDYLVRDPQIP